MDSDDISLPKRIKKQVSFMDDNPEVGVCGTWIKYKGVSWRPWRSKVYKYPTKSRDIKSMSLFNSNFSHPSVIMRKSLLKKFKLKYDMEHYDAEDYGLWQKCSFCFPLANIPEVLLLYRVNSESITNRKENRSRETVQRVNRSSIQALGMEFSPEERLLYRNCTIDFEPKFLIKFHSWLQELRELNFEKQVYPEPEFSRAVSGEWFSACYRSCELGINVWFLFWKLSLSRMSKFDIGQLFKFFLKCVIKRKKHNLKDIAIPAA